MNRVPGAECHVSVIGLGYVGLPAALMFARSGLKTIGVDINPTLLTQLRGGVCPLEEKELIEVFADTATKSNFSVRDVPPVAEAYVIAVPTPLDPRRKIADLRAVASACESIVPVLRRGALVILESTVPPLTCREVVTPILERSGLNAGSEIFVAHCPERLFPGNVAAEIVQNPRIVGGCTEAATQQAVELYRRFVKAEVMQTNDVTAEFCKLSENAYRDVNIALANELALIAEKLGITIGDAITLANRHPRVNILKPGIGVGGHCIPIDPWFLAEVAPDEAMLIPTARRINDQQPERVAARIRQSVAHLADPLLAIYGITYKADVNDRRESPALHVVEILRRDGYRVETYDPVAGLRPGGDLYAFLSGKDALAILVEHAEIVEVLTREPERLRSALAHPVVLRF